MRGPLSVVAALALPAGDAAYVLPHAHTPPRRPAIRRSTGVRSPFGGDADDLPQPWSVLHSSSISLGGGSGTGERELRRLERGGVELFPLPTIDEDEKDRPPTLPSGEFRSVRTAAAAELTHEWMDGWMDGWRAFMLGCIWLAVICMSVVCVCVCVCMVVSVRPKQSLGQNYLSDQNYVRKICDALIDTR